MGMSEILLILFVVLILFGPEDLPKIARTIGKGIFEIRKATNEISKEFQRSSIDNPINMVNKAFEQAMSTPVSDTEKEQGVAAEHRTNEELIQDQTQIPTDHKIIDKKAEAPSD